MTGSDPIADPTLERQGRRMVRPALRFLAIAVLVLIPGIVLVIVDGWLGLGVALILLASVPGSLAFGLLVSGSVARWAARHRLFA